MEIIGYHGTTYESANDIYCRGVDKEKLRKNWINDLGNGFYTYIDLVDAPFPNKAYDNSILYAKTFKRTHKVRALELTVDLDESKVLNLTNFETKKSLSFMIQEVKNAAYTTIPNLKSGASKRNNRDGFLIEYLIKHEYIPEPQVIVENTHTDFNHIRSNFYNGTEMVLRDLSVIKDIKLI